MATLSMRWNTMKPGAHRPGEVAIEVSVSASRGGVGGRSVSLTLRQLDTEYPEWLLASMTDVEAESLVRQLVDGIAFARGEEG